MTELANPDHLEKWRAQVLSIVKELKAVPVKDWGGRDKIKVGIFLDDAMVKVTIDVAMITAIPAEQLAESLYAAAVEMVAAAPRDDAGRPTGEVKKFVSVPQPETVQFAEVQDPKHFNVTTAEPEGCWRKLEPDFTQACPNNAGGGIRIKLFPAPSVQKRYGKRPLLALVLDLPVCGACAARMTSTEVINQLEPGLWGTFSKEAQRRNRGFLPIKEESQIEFVPFNDPEYVLLRQQMAKAANSSGASQPPDFLK